MDETKRTLGALLAAFTVVLLFGCSKDEGARAASTDQAETTPTKVMKLAFVTNNPSQFWKIAEAGIRKYEKEAKVQVAPALPRTRTRSCKTLPIRATTPWQSA